MGVRRNYDAAEVHPGELPLIATSFNQKAGFQPAFLYSPAEKAALSNARCRRRDQQVGDGVDELVGVSKAPQLALYGSKKPRLPVHAQFVLILELDHAPLHLGKGVAEDLARLLAVAAELGLARLRESPGKFGANIDGKGVYLCIRLAKAEHTVLRPCGFRAIVDAFGA
jgi:hypothetical protein